MDYDAFLVQHLPLVDKVVRFIARRHHLSSADADEFASLVRFKLVDRDFAILRKFEQRSSVSTYLTVVIERLCLDFCIAKWGKWRPSAAARRLGPVAILLEQLIVRENMTFGEAVGVLQTNHGVSETRAELHAMLLRLPVRLPRGHVDEVDRDSLATFVAPLDPEHEHLIERVHQALAVACETLGEEDRRLVALRFGAGLPVSQIARELERESKPLYRRFDHILRALRADLERQGISDQEIAVSLGVVPRWR